MGPCVQEGHFRTKNPENCLRIWIGLPDPDPECSGRAQGGPRGPWGPKGPHFPPISAPLGAQGALRGPRAPLWGAPLFPPIDDDVTL